MKIACCRLCKKKKLHQVLSLGNLYLADFVSGKYKKKSKRYPLSLVLCKNCSLLQLTHTTPPFTLYNERYGYYSGISSTMRNELFDVVSKAQKFVELLSGDIVLDIGCNDKTLLLSYTKKDITKVGFDPVGKFAKGFKEENEIFINDYFSKRKFVKLLGNKKAKVITAISMFYDIDDPNTFVKDVAQILAEDGVFIIQQNYIVEMLLNSAFDNIVHEHLCYYSLFAIEKLLAKFELEVFDVQIQPINGGSFRTYIKHRSYPIPINMRVLEMRQKEKRMNLKDPVIYKEFMSKVRKNCLKLKHFIKGEVRGGKTVFVYGASTRGNTLLQFAKLDNNLIKAAVERNPEKWGKKIESVDIPIISEVEARERRPDYMLVLPWFFKEEFIEREKEYLKTGGAFIFPLPTMEIIR